MGLLLKNGEIITADSRYVADIYCEGETITAIGRDLDAPPGTRIVDATGKYVFPGFIDPHTHIYLPFMGTFAKDTYETGTRAALCGGTTTLIDFVIPSRSEDPMTALETWRAQGAGACMDYTYHMAVTRFDDGVEAQLREIVGSGVSSFKVFLAYKGAFGLPDDELFKAMRLARELGVLVTAHCENPDMVSQLQNELVAAGKLGPEWHEPSRPEIVEAEGTRHLCTMAELTGAHCYVVHLSNELALRQAVEARYRGVNVYVETLIQYLLLDKTYAERPDFEGAKFVMSPPLRDKKHQSVLWHGLKTGLIHTLATDHCPFDFAGQKDMGRDNFCLIPNGIPALEDRVRMYFTHGVATGRVDLHRFVETASTNAAKLFGLFPRKGTIQLGADADLVVYDPTWEGTISAATQHVNNDYSAFEGWPVKGRCAAVTVRGKVQVEDGEFVGEVGRGRFLAREPNHF
jgi:dihydropyrimidinase